MVTGKCYCRPSLVFSAGALSPYLASQINLASARVKETLVLHGLRLCHLLAQLFQLGPCFLWLQPFGADGAVPCNAQGNPTPSVSDPSVLSCTSEPGALGTSHDQGLSQGRYGALSLVGEEEFLYRTLPFPPQQGKYGAEGDSRRYCS